jgi:hypothetical protein
MSNVRRWFVVAAGLFTIAELVDGIVDRLPTGIASRVDLAKTRPHLGRRPPEQRHA